MLDLFVKVKGWGWVVELQCSGQVELVDIALLDVALGHLNATQVSIAVRMGLPRDRND